MVHTEITALAVKPVRTFRFAVMNLLQLVSHANQILVLRNLTFLSSCCLLQRFSSKVW